MLVWGCAAVARINGATNSWGYRGVTLGSMVLLGLLALLAIGVAWRQRALATVAAGAIAVDAAASAAYAMTTSPLSRPLQPAPPRWAVVVRAEPGHLRDPECRVAGRRLLGARSSGCAPARRSSAGARGAAPSVPGDRRAGDGARHRPQGGAEHCVRPRRGDDRAARDRIPHAGRRRALGGDVRPQVGAGRCRCGMSCVRARSDRRARGRAHGDAPPGSGACRSTLYTALGMVGSALAVLLSAAVFVSMIAHVGLRAVDRQGGCALAVGHALPLAADPPARAN